MAEIVNLSNSISSIRGIALKILDFEDEWVTLPDDYCHQVEMLGLRLQTYEQLVNLHGLHKYSPAIMKTLKKAEEALKRAEARLEGLKRSTSGSQCCSFIRFWYAKLSILIFPENVESILKKANYHIDSMTQVLKREGEMATEAREGGQRRPVAERFVDNDKLYVPRKEAESKVIKAIENSKGHRVILLYGGIGKGKSTLARFMVIRYQQERENGNGFEHVIWEPCANCSKKDTSTKQLDILQRHSPNSLGVSESQEESSSEHLIARAFRDFLSAKKVLLILDDVSDSGFLYEMWIAASGSGEHVKILVTSIKSDICSSINQESELIAMGDPTEDEAMAILASQVKLKLIPENLKATARKIIDATEKNPLALACIASQFSYGGDNEDPRAWKEAYNDLDKLLHHEEKNRVLGDAPRSLWAAMKLRINSLEAIDARKILFLMYECKGESVPEALLRILHARIKTTRATFFLCRNELRMRELLKYAANSKDNVQTDGESRAWTLGSLVKHYIKAHLADEEEMMKSAIGKLVEESSARDMQDHRTETKETEKSRVAIVLCALYFDQSHIGIYEIVTKAMTRANLAYSNDSLNDLRRQAIEPILWLLDKEPEDECWEESDISRVRKVFLAYICNGQLDDQNISHLLKLHACNAAQLATLKAISQICLIEEKALFNTNSLSFVQALVHLMERKEGLPTSVQEAASRTLSRVCWKAGQEQSSFPIIDTPGILDVLVSALAIRTGWSAIYASGGLGSLACISHQNRQKIIEKAGALVSLVQRLFEDNMPDLQAAAAVALGNILWAEDDSINRIASQNGILDGVVKLLSTQHQQKAKQESARALPNLSDTKYKILDVALPGLVKALTVHSNPDLQGNAAAALGNLAFSPASKQRIICEEGAVDGLVKLLSVNDQPRVQEKSAGALINLTTTKDGSLERQLLDRALPALVQSLTVHNNPALQENAAAALGNLAISPESQRRIICEEWVVDGLVKLLSVHTEPEVQEKLAAALTNLAYTPDYFLKLQLLDRALAALVQSLTVHNNLALQENAAAALANLALSLPESQRRIICEEGAVDGLVKLRLSVNDEPKVQEISANALRNLTSTEPDSLQRQLLDKALAALVKALTVHNNRALQENAAIAYSSFFFA